MRTQEAVVTRADDAPARSRAVLPWRSPVWRRNLALGLASVPLLLFLLLPLLALVLRVSPADVLTHLVDPNVAAAIQLSLGTTLVTLALTLGTGTPLAYLLARRRFRGHTVLDTLLDLPIVLPPAVAGIALLVAFGRLGLVGQWLSAAGIDLAFTTAAVVLAQTFVAAPFYVKTASAAFAAADRDLEQAAALDGAGALGVFRFVTLPLTLLALFGGAMMTWARARRVRRHHHLRWELSRPHRDDAAGHLPGLRVRPDPGADPGAGLARTVVRRAAAGQARPAAAHRLYRIRAA